MLTTLQGQWIPAHCAPLDRISVRHPTNHSAPPSRLGCESSLAFPLVPWKPRWPMVAEEDGAFPVEQSLAPTVVESNVPERTRRRGEYGARVSGRKITVSFFCPPLRSNSKNKPSLNFFGGVLQSLLITRRREARDWSRKFFFSFFIFFFFSFPPPTPKKRILCVAVVCSPLSPQRWWSERSKWRSDRGRVPTIWCNY